MQSTAHAQEKWVQLEAQIHRLQAQVTAYQTWIQQLQTRLSLDKQGLTIQAADFSVTTPEGTLSLNAAGEFRCQAKKVSLESHETLQLSGEQVHLNSNEANKN